MIPGTSVRSTPPWRRAMRRVTFSEYVSSSLVPKITSSTTETAAAMSAVSSAHQNESTWIALSSRSDANRSANASITSTPRKPITSVNGRRSAARIGGRTALTIATTAATSTAPQKLGMST